MTAPQPILEEMPYPVRNQIFGCLETNDKLALRLTSSTLKSLVDSSTIRIRRWILKLSEDTVEIQFNHHNRLYSQQDLQTVVVIRHGRVTTREIRTDAGMQYYDHALKDFKDVLDVFRRLEMQLFILKISGNTMNPNQQIFLHKFQVLIGSLVAQRFTVDLDVQESSIIFMMLDKITPGKLEFLDVIGSGFAENSEVQRLVAHPAFRQLKIFRQKAKLVTNLADFLHLEEFDIHVGELMVEDIRMMKKEYGKVRHGIIEIRCPNFNQEGVVRELLDEYPELESDENGFHLNFRSDNGEYNAFLCVLSDEIIMGTF